MGMRIKDQDETMVSGDAIGNASTGVKRLWRAPFAGEVLYLAMRVRTAGATGSMLGDCNINGTSVFTTAANRPTLTTGTDVEVKRDAIDGTRTFAAGDLLDLSIDQVHTTPAVDTTLFAVVRQRRTTVPAY